MRLRERSRDDHRDLEGARESKGAVTHFDLTMNTTPIPSPTRALPPPTNKRSRRPRDQISSRVFVQSSSSRDGSASCTPQSRFFNQSISSLSSSSDTSLHRHSRLPKHCRRYRETDSRAACGLEGAWSEWNLGSIKCLGLQADITTTTGHPENPAWDAGRVWRNDWLSAQRSRSPSAYHQRCYADRSASGSGGHYCSRSSPRTDCFNSNQQRHSSSSFALAPSAVCSSLPSACSQAGGSQPSPQVCDLEAAKT